MIQIIEITLIPSIASKESEDRFVESNVEPFDVTLKHVMNLTNLEERMAEEGESSFRDLDEDDAKNGEER